MKKEPGKNFEGGSLMCPNIGKTQFQAKKRVYIGTIKTNKELNPNLKLNTVP